MTSIAVIGTSGALGEYVLQELQDSKYQGKISYPIKAVSTKDRSTEGNEKIQYIQGNISESADTLISDLAGTDVIISLATDTAQVFENTEKVIKAVKPKIYIPSEFGTENDVIDPSLIIPADGAKLAHSSRLSAELKHITKIVCIHTSLFRIPPLFLYSITNHIGIEQESKTVTYVKNDQQSLLFTTGADIARVIGAIATTEVSKVLSKYKIFSGIKKVKDVVTDLEKESGTTYAVKYVTLEQAKNDYLKTIETGSPDLIGYLLYLLYCPPGSGLHFTGDEREVINPGESLWKWGSW